MGIMIDAVRLEVAEAKDTPSLTVGKAPNGQWFMGKDRSGVFVKLGGYRYLYISANDAPETWIGEAPAPDLKYQAVDITVQTKTSHPIVTPYADYGEQ